jgi:hypothetical protein
VTVTAPDNPAKPYPPDRENRPVAGVVRWLVTVILPAERRVSGLTGSIVVTCGKLSP